MWRDEDMIVIELTLWDTDHPTYRVTSEDAFRIENGYSQKDLFALYQRARAKLGVTKYGKSKEDAGEKV